MAEKSGPETYAPPERRPPEKRSDVERIAFLRRQRGEAAPANGPAAEDLNAVVRRVAGDSIEEIDRVIRALENVRDMMRNEGERVSREIAGYASLSHAAATAMKVIADSIHQWKDASDKSGPRSVS
jgi:phosphopantothenate synthetase